MTLPANWDGYPDHRHEAGVEDADQEEVYIPLEGSPTLVAGEERIALRPGMMVRVGPEQYRRPARAQRRSAGGARNRYMGMVGQRLDAWFDAYGWIAATGYLQAPSRADDSDHEPGCGIDAE